MIPLLPVSQFSSIDVLIDPWTMSHLSSLADFFSRSNKFYARHKRPIPHGTTLEALVLSKKIVSEDANKYIESTRIIVHFKAKSIARAFLEYKKVTGSRIEKNVYADLDWNLERFFVRLIKQRPIAFLTAKDRTLLRDGQQFQDATSNWDRVGTSAEGQSVSMKHYLTYEEMMISSLIGVSGYTAYLNDGRRDNLGNIHFEGSQREGIMIGLVGARFERSKRMDNLYGPGKPEPHSFLALFFPGETFEERYKARMRITIETLLLEAQARGVDAKRKTWVSVVGLGLGVWQVNDHQSQWYIETFALALQRLNVSHIHTLEFLWIDVHGETRKYIENVGSKTDTRIIWSKRNPSAKLADSSLLLLTTYAWDANSYPGNEFYLGMLKASGDPAAACSSLISETQNPEINTAMLKSISYLA